MTEEFLLSPENLPQYLAEKRLLKPGAEVKVFALGGGISNIVLMIEAEGVRWVAKQSLEKLRVEADWHSQRERIFREADSIELLGPRLGESRLPEVIHRNLENYFFIMTAAPEGAAMWKKLLLEGNVDLAVARRAGAALAALGRLVRGKERFEDRTVFDELRLDPYYRTVAAKHADVKSQIERLVAESGEIRAALVHGDYSPKNMLVREGKIFLIDFEGVHWGDPSFDTGFFLNHLFLKAFYRPQWAAEYFAAVREAWQGYAEGLSTEMSAEREPMTLRHLGALMLARIDGKSPAEYIREEPTKESVRRLAKRILLEQPKRLEEVIEMARKEIRN